MGNDAKSTQIGDSMKVAHIHKLGMAPAVWWLEMSNMSKGGIVSGGKPKELMRQEHLHYHFTYDQFLSYSRHSLSKQST